MLIFGSYFVPILGSYFVPVLGSYFVPILGSHSSGAKGKHREHEIRAHFGLIFRARFGFVFRDHFGFVFRAHFGSQMVPFWCEGFRVIVQIKLKSLSAKTHLWAAPGRAAHRHGPKISASTCSAPIRNMSRPTSPLLYSPPRKGYE